MPLFKRRNIAPYAALFSVLCAIAVTKPSHAQDPGLHNSTKVFSAPADLTWKHWDDPDELERTWMAAIVRVPAGPGRSTRATTEDLERQTAATGQKLPTVIYLHGCSGIWSGTHQRIRFLAENGFLVIAPASLARDVYPRSCNVETREGGLFRGTVVLRKNDAGYAIEKARQLSSVDADNIVLMGFSEGALTTVLFEPQNERQFVRARVAEGWTCHAGWLEYKGVRAREGEPVLTLVGENDPWYQDQWTKGDCTPFLDPENGSRSIVYRDEKLKHRHGLLDVDPVREDVLGFLKEHVDF